jgi:hypothetical protein
MEGGSVEAFEMHAVAVFDGVIADDTGDRLETELRTGNPALVLVEMLHDGDVADRARAVPGGDGHLGAVLLLFVSQYVEFFQKTRLA